jgi:type II secretory pathway predicted ATPase ExeA
MDQAQFGLRQQPFPSTPDVACYYPATSHERALSRLQRGLADGEGVLLLTGPAGTGKTLLGHCLLERLDGDCITAFLAAGHFAGRAGLLQAVLYDLSLPYQGLAEQELRLALTDHLLRSYAQRRRTILVVDEAHHLDADLLEELRLWGNLEAHSRKALQLVLLGQPPLLQTLQRFELASLRQRVAVRAAVEPLGLAEAADYLLHHLRIAGGRPERILTDEAAELLARRTGGVPRLLNQAARGALALAAEAGAAEIEVEVALEALALLGLEEDPPGVEAGAQRRSLTADVGDEEPTEVVSVDPPGPVVGPPPAAAADSTCRLFVSSRDAG